MLVNIHGYNLYPKERAKEQRYKFVLYVVLVCGHCYVCTGKQILPIQCVDFAVGIERGSLWSTLSKFLLVGSLYYWSASMKDVLLMPEIRPAHNKTCV